jgi:hypothetical protein
MTFALFMAPACRDAGLTDAYMALDSGGMLQRTVFYTDTATIYCVGKLDSGVADVSVSGVVRASSLYVSDRDAYVPVDEIVAVSAADQTPGMGQSVVAFQLDKAVPEPSVDPSTVPFNPGTYVCDLYVNGELARYPSRSTFPIARSGRPSTGIPARAGCDRVPGAPAR